MNKIIEKIRNKNWQEILNYAKYLSSDERYKTINLLKEINIDKDILNQDGTNLTGDERKEFYENKQQIDGCINYFLIVCTRNYTDLKKLEIKNDYFTSNPFYSFISTPNYQPLVDYYNLFPPDYLNKVVKDISKERFRNINIRMLWKMYEHKWVQFDEEIFVRSMFHLQGFDNDHFEDAIFLLDNPNLINDVFLKFYKYEIPILDLIKAKTIDYSNGLSAKANVYWTEVFKILIKKNAINDRSIISHLLESLLNNWKKPHLDWHIRLLELLQPSNADLLQNQATLFSILGTGQTSIINYSIHSIKSIHNHANFDKKTFLNELPVIFSNEKCIKSILISLDIIEVYLSKSVEIEIEYREQLFVLFMLSDTKIQEKLALILVQYFNDKDLKQIIEPYLPYLKQKAKETLSINDEVKILELNPNSNINNELLPVNQINNWDQLLLHIGTCIRTKTSTDIDLFFEGLNQLQFEVPTDFEKQLKPYTKQLFNRFWENNTMRIFSFFIECWIKNTNGNFIVKDNNSLPFLSKKSAFLLKKLNTKNNLPFLSTPTHLPFFVLPTILLDKLLIYEENKIEVDLEDLIVACNRILFSEINNETLEKSKKLKGNYAQAIQYLFGVSTKINFTDVTLPLWTQITRIKNPNGIFSEFEKSKASNYPTVINPFEIDYKIEIDANEYATWYRLKFENNWNFHWYNKENVKLYDAIFYNTASADKASRVDINYQLSLNPLYLDAQLCRYIPDTATGNEVAEFEECLYPIQFILENQLHIYHSGWLYVAVCLLFEKKISRDLASEYIQLAISRKENLDTVAKTIGKLISMKYAPVNRLIEYLDKPNTFSEIKLFQYQVLSNCILHFDKENLPTNSKKIILYYKEWQNFLRLDLPKNIEEKINEIKK